MVVEFIQAPGALAAVDIKVPLLAMRATSRSPRAILGAGVERISSRGTEISRLYFPSSNLSRGWQYPKPLIWSTTKDDRFGPHPHQVRRQALGDGLALLYFEVARSHAPALRA